MQVSKHLFASFFVCVWNLVQSHAIHSRSRSVFLLMEVNVAHVHAQSRRMRVLLVLHDHSELVQSLQNKHPSSGA